MSGFSYQYLNYRGLGDLERALQAIALRLPDDVEVVVGIPRSGLLAGSILALQLNLPLVDLSGYLEGRLLTTGRRPLRQSPSGVSRRPAIVDDSVLTGYQMAAVRGQIARSAARIEPVFAAPFVSREGREAVDIFAEVVDPPRVFAWNILHHPELLARSCVDIDGVLCLDPEDRENDDGPLYDAFLRRAKPLFLPSAPVGYVVTSRLEKYRDSTERWLRDHGVEYSKLVMLDLPDAKSRQALGNHARHKADFYARSDAELFVESDYVQATAIAAASGRQVFAIDRREMIYPSFAQAAAKAPGPLVRSVARVPPALAAREAMRKRVLAARRALNIRLSKTRHG